MKREVPKLVTEEAQRVYRQRVINVMFDENTTVARDTAFEEALAVAYEAGWESALTTVRPPRGTAISTLDRVQAALHVVAQVKRLPCKNKLCHRHVDCLASRVEEALTTVSPQ